MSRRTFGRGRPVECIEGGGATSVPWWPILTSNFSMSRAARAGRSSPFACPLRSKPPGTATTTCICAASRPWRRPSSPGSLDHR